MMKMVIWLSFQFSIVFWSCNTTDVISLDYSGNISSSCEHYVELYSSTQSIMVIANKSPRICIEMFVYSNILRCMKHWNKARRESLPLVQLKTSGSVLSSRSPQYESTTVLVQVICMICSLALIAITVEPTHDIILGTRFYLPTFGLASWDGI